MLDEPGSNPRAKEGQFGHLVARIKTANRRREVDPSLSTAFAEVCRLALTGSFSDKEGRG